MKDFKVRQEWVEASQFHELSDEEVLDQVVRAAAGHGKQPTILLDLDSTLYEVAPRTLQILREWSVTSEAAEFPEVRRALDNIEIPQVGYSLRDTLASVGLEPSSPEVKRALSSAKPFWADRFFSSAYLVHDRPYPGAAVFAHALVAAGAQVAYLTGRDEPGMGKGTRLVLERDGFPINPRQASFLLKADRDGDDHAHKVNAVREVVARCPILASFENEPKNLVAMQEQLPDALHVFVHTVCSDQPARPGRGLYRVKGFHGFRARPSR